MKVTDLSTFDLGFVWVFSAGFFTNKVGLPPLEENVVCGVCMPYPCAALIQPVTMPDPDG